jgi:glycine/D-amino acid oxidase-like deaminating enzyme
VSYDIAIAGSGIVGLSAAYKLAPDHDVIVVDSAGIGEGTSSRASGMMTAPVDYPEQPDWAAHTTEFFRELDGTGTFSWTDRDYVQGIRPTEVDEAKNTARLDGVRLVSFEEYDTLYDDNAPYEYALVWDDCGYCEVDDLLATLYNEARQRGVEFRPDTCVESVLMSHGRAVGLQTEYGDIEADSVVMATGSATRELLQEEIELPIAKFTWNVGYLDVDIELDYPFPMGGDSQSGVYWRGTDSGQLLIGVEHQYESVTNPENKREIGDQLDSLIAETLPDLLKPVSKTSDIVRYEVCPMADSTTPDAKAIIDSSPDGVDNLVVAAGFHGAGVMSAGSIGTAIRSLLIDEAAPFSLDPFSLDRFNTHGSDFPFVSLFSQNK